MNRGQSTGIPNAAAAEGAKQSLARPMMTLSGLIRGMVYRRRNDAAWTMTCLDGSVETLTGYRPDQLIGNRETAYGDLIESDYRERAWSTVQEAADHGRQFQITYPIRKASGEMRWMWERGRTLLDDQGRPAGLEGIITDVTELKNAEQALRESEGRYRLLADNSLDIIWQMDMDLRFIYVNPAIEDILGYRPADCIGNHLSDYCSSETLETVHAAVTHGLKEETRQARRTLTVRLRHKNGCEVSLEVRARFLFGEGTDPIGIQGTSRDITDHLEAEAAARRQSEGLQTIMDNIPFMVAFLEERGQPLWVNRSWENTLGWKSSEIRTKDFMCELYPDPEYRRYVMDFIRLADGTWRDFETRVADGSMRHTRWKNIRLTDGSIIGIGEGVTEARRACQRQRELEQQLLQIQKMEAVGRLAGGVAHDFNNLLAVILGYADMVMETLVPSHAHYEPVKDIYDAATRARDLTRQLLDFGRKQLLAIEVLDVNTMVTGFEKLIRRIIGEDICLDLKLSPSPLYVRADVSQLDQVLMNLAVNARDAIPDGGRLIIETTRVALDLDYAANTAGTTPGDYALIRVCDSGDGMDPATLRRIFEPFFTTKGKDIGAGLGLSTVYGIVKQHGGNIWADSEPGQGTTFRVYLPLASGEKTTVAAPIPT